MPNTQGISMLAQFAMLIPEISRSKIHRGPVNLLRKLWSVRAAEQR